MGWGGCEAPGLRPEVLRFEYRFDEDERFAWNRYSGAVRPAGVLDPCRTLSLAPPTGGPGRRAPVPDRASNPLAPAGLSAYPRRRSFVPTGENLLRTDRGRLRGDTTDKPSRSSTPESRIGRRTCALPVPSGEVSIGAPKWGEDKERRRKSQGVDFAGFDPRLSPWRAGIDPRSYPLRGPISPRERLQGPKESHRSRGLHW